MEKKNNIILSFDLDFTLINNRDGIVDSFNYALREFNLKEKEPSEIEKMIGIPLNDMFNSVCDLDPTKMSLAFRKYYSIKGIYKVNLLKGVKKKLKEFKKHSFILGIITSKKQDLAKKLVEFLKISKYFDYILGESDEIKSKDDPKIKEFFDRMYPGDQIIVIGDHLKDAILSKNLNCPFIGVLTGLHSLNDLKSIYLSKYMIVDSVSDLIIDDIYSLIQ